jgi:hypothetical protein
MRTKAVGSPSGVNVTVRSAFVFIAPSNTILIVTMPGETGAGGVREILWTLGALVSMTNVSPDAIMPPVFPILSVAEKENTAAPSPVLDVISVVPDHEVSEPERGMVVKAPPSGV